MRCSEAVPSLVIFLPSCLVKPQGDICLCQLHFKCVDSTDADSWSLPTRVPSGCSASQWVSLASASSALLSLSQAFTPSRSSPSSLECFRGTSHPSCLKRTSWSCPFLSSPHFNSWPCHSLSWESQKQTWTTPQHLHFHHSQYPAIPESWSYFIIRFSWIHRLHQFHQFQHYHPSPGYNHLLPAWC